MQISGLLLDNEIPAKLIQSNDGFNLFNLIEVRSFFNSINEDDSSPVLSKDIWNNAKREFISKHSKSSNFELCKRLIKDFQKNHSKVKYKSDFEIFIKESKLEDFAFEDGDTINVSTIHKAKGKEFDNVVLLLEDFNIRTDDDKRQLYVAMTRAKKNLIIHYNGNYFDNLSDENLSRIDNSETYTKPNQLMFHLSHSDINLGYFNFIQHRINNLISGQKLKVDDDKLKNSQNDDIVKFSKRFITVKEALLQDGYVLKESKVNFILYWTFKNEEKGEEREIRIVLPELCFIKK